MIDFAKLAGVLPPNMRLNMAMGMLLAGEVILSRGNGGQDDRPEHVELASAIYWASQVLDPEGTGRLLAILHGLALKTIEDEDGLACERCDP